MTNARQELDGLVKAESLSNLRRGIALTFLSTAYVFYAWAWNSVDVLRPYIAADLHLSLPQAGSLYSAQALGALAGAVVNGQLADRFGRRNALMAVMIGYGVMLLAGVFVTSYAQVLVQRCIMGYFMGSMYPITVGIYSAIFSQSVRGRVASIIIGSSWLAASGLGFAASAIFKAGMDWHLLLWVGILPIVLSGFAPLFVPNDRTLIPYGSTAAGGLAASKLPITELFVRGLRARTVLLTLLAGLNFFAYQAFSGWATTYLQSERAFGGADTNTIMGWMYAGSIAGGFFWGWIGDRFGRRASASGFFLTAGLILLFLFVPLGVAGESVVAFLYGGALGCSVVWGPWLAELYPDHLRSTAASIFNWGRVVSFIAPLLTGFVAERFGLQYTMSLASLVFVIAALIWLRLPETLVKRRSRQEAAAAPRDGEIESIPLASGS